MKALLVLVLGSLCGAAMAGEAKDAEQIPVEQYSYSQHLDIARVLSMSEVPNVCEVVPARMTYEDSKGQKHILEYRVMGNGCSNG
jgi:septum formation inhibitor MinC